MKMARSKKMPTAGAGKGGPPAGEGFTMERLSDKVVLFVSDALGFQIFDAKIFSITESACLTNAASAWLPMWPIRKTLPAMGP